jgi:Flp pilus assembly protein TadD
MIMPPRGPCSKIIRAGSAALTALSCLLAVSGAIAAVPAKPLLTPQTVHTDDMVLAPTVANDPAEMLARYLRILAEHPHDLTALIGAGRAALDVGDPDAAVSFYARAEELSPRDGRIKAGLGSAMVQLVQPRPALRLFEEAVQYGVPVAEIASDRGLAYALRGDSKRARADFELALSARPDPETTRRLALTQAIDGDAASAMVTLDPLLRRQDKAAWRARVFVLAITGDIKTAQATANAMLPKQQAEALTPFLDRIGKLRPSQQAAAVHFGQFPADGRKYSEAELFAAAGSAPPPPIVTPASRRAASGNNPMADDQGDGVEEDHGGKPGRSRPERPRDKILTAKKPDIWAATQKNSFSLDSTGDKKPDALPSKTEEPEAKPVSRSAKKDTPPESKKTAEAAEKKSDATKAAKDKNGGKTETGSKAANAAKGKNPERQWVQVATGAYKPDLGKAWDKLKEKYPALLARRSAWTTPLNRTNRVLIGPFKTEDDAQAFVNKASGGGFMTSRFTSSTGQVVEPIP